MKRYALILFALIIAAPANAAAPMLLKDVTVQGNLVELKPQTMKQATTPANPSSLFNKLYFKSDDKLYTLNSAGLETAVGSGSGSGTGAREYISNTNAESATTGWNTYADAAATSPVDGTGGSATNLTFTRTTTAGEIIRETASFKLAKAAANAQGMGVSTDFSVDLQDRSGGPIYLSFDYLAGTGYTSGDVKVFVYDVTSSTLISVQDSQGTAGAVPAGNTRFTGVFYPVSSASSSYRLILHFTTTSTTAYSFIFDTAHAGGANLIPGAIVTDWQSYTPTWTASTTNPSLGNGSIQGKYRRVGSNIEVSIMVVFGSTTTFGSGIFYFSLPSGVAIDTSRLSQTGTLQAPIGMVGAYDGAKNITGTATIANSGTNLLAAYGPGTTSWTSTAPSTWTSNGFIGLSASLPIVGWTSGAQMSTGELIAQTPTPLTASSSVKTPTASGNYNAMTGNSLTLTAGKWRLVGNCSFDNGGSAPAYLTVACGWTSANGNDTTTQPGILSAVANLTVLTPMVSDYPAYLNLASAANARLALPSIDVSCSATCTVYLMPFATATTIANARVTAYASATKVPDFTMYGVTPNFEILTTNSTTKTPAANTNWHAHSGNSLTLSGGTWRLMGGCRFDNSGSTPGYNDVQCGWFGANGADNSTTPSTLSSVTILSQTNPLGGQGFGATTTTNYWFANSPELIVRCASSCTVFLDTFSNLTTIGLSRISVTAIAQRLQ